MKIYRIFEDGNLLWQGRAHDPEHAEEKCFSDESPGSLLRYTMHAATRCRFTGDLRWACVYENQPLSASHLSL